MKRLIITEEEKKHILSLHQNLNIKGILQEGLKGDVYTTENDQKIYYGTNTSFDYVDIKKGTKFLGRPNGASAWNNTLIFSCSGVGTVKFDNGGTGNKHFTYNKKTYWSNALQKRLISVFCSSSSSSNTGCLKGNCQNGYGEYRNTDNKSLYKGNYKNGYRDGYGETIWLDGTKYEGNFIKNSMTGYGTITRPSGQKYEGNFDQGLYDGKGKYTDYNGTIWWGTWSYDNTTDQTYYKNTKGCYFKGKGGRSTDGYWALSGKDSNDMDNMECTPGKWIDLEKPQTPVGSNAGSDVGNSPSGDVGGGSVLGCTQYNDCSSKDGSTTKFVKCDTCSEISRLQACLKDANGNILKTDSKWGRKTEAALNLLNYNGTDGITSEIITTICTNYSNSQV